MKMWTEKKLAALILRLIDAQDRCAIHNTILDKVFDRRPDRLDELKPLFDPYQERLKAFCNRYHLVVVPGNPPGRTIFTAQPESETVA